MYIKAGKSAGKAARTRQLAADSASRRPKHERRSLRAGRGREGRGGRELFPPPSSRLFPVARSRLWRFLFFPLAAPLISARSRSRSDFSSPRSAPRPEDHSLEFRFRDGRFNRIASARLRASKAELARLVDRNPSSSKFSRRSAGFPKFPPPDVRNPNRKSNFYVNLSLSLSLWFSRAEQVAPF